MPQVDIKLGSSADVSGVQRMQAELGKLQQTVEKKLSAPDLFKSVLGGVGLGSGFAIASKVAEQIVGYFERAAAAAQRIESLTDRTAKAVSDRIALAQTAEQQLTIAVQRRARLQHDLAAAANEEDRRRLEAEQAENDLAIAQLEQKIKKDRDSEKERLAATVAEGQEQRRALDERLANAKAWLAIQENNYTAAKNQLALGINAKDAELNLMRAAAGREEALKRVADIQELINQKAERELSSRLGVTKNALALIESDAALSDAEKRAQALPLLREEQRLLRERITLLERELELTADPAAADSIRGRIDKLRDESGKTSAEIQKAESPQTLTQKDSIGMRDLSDPTKHYQTAGAGFFGGIAGFIGEIGTMADQVASSIKSNLSSAVSSVSQGITGWLTGAMTFKQALTNIGQTIVTSLLNSIIQMGVQWAISATLGKVAMLGLDATADTLRAGRVVKENAAEAATLPMKTAGAAASGISSFGVALAFGALAVALIMGLAGGFATGGYFQERPSGFINGPGNGTSDSILARVSNKEWIAPEWMTQHPVYGPMVAMLEAARSGAPAFKFGGSTGPDWITKLGTTGIDDNVVNWWKNMSGGAQIQGTGNLHAAAESATLSLGADWVAAMEALPSSAIGGIARPYAPGAGADASAGAGGQSMRSLLSEFHGKFVTIVVPSAMEATRIAKRSEARGDIVQIVRQEFGIAPSA